MINEDGFVADTDGFVEDNKGLTGHAPASSPIDSFRKYMSTAGLGPKPNNVSSAVAQNVSSLIPAPLLRSLITSAFPPDTTGTQTPKQSFQADQLGNPDTTVSDAQNVYGLATAVPALRSAGGAIDALSSAGKDKIASWLELLKAPKAAEALVPAEDALSAGLTAKAGQVSELAQAKNTKNALYGRIPKDIKAPTPTIQAEAENILNEIKNLPISIQNRITPLVKDYQELGNGKGMALGDLGVIRSELGDMAANSKGVEKLYAARLSKALAQDMENFSNSPVLPASQQNTLFAPELRKKWVNASEAQNNIPDSVADQEIRYWQGSGPNLTNSDIGKNTKIANSYFKDFSTLQQHPVTQALERAKPAQMSQVVFKGGSVDDVNVAKAVLGKTYDNIAGQFYDQLVKSPNLESKLSKYSPEFLQAAIGPQRLQALQKLAQFRALVSKIGTGAKIGAGAIGAAGVYEGLRKLSH